VIYEGAELKEFVVVARDITERVKATQSMLQSEQKYRNVIQNINLGLMEVDLEETVVYVNEAFCDMTGYVAEDLLGKTASAILIDPDDALQQKQIQHANALRVEGDSSAYELRIRNKKGESLWMIISGAPVKNGQGEVVGSLGIHNDITERKKEEIQRLELLKQVEQSNQNLLDNQIKLRAVINSALDAVITIGEDGIVLEWNAQAYEIFGFTAKETIGKRLSELIIPEEYAEAHERGMKHFLKTGEGPVLQKRIEITGKHKKGHHFNVELSISPIKLEEGYIFSAFVRDITLKKKAEEDMAKALEKQRELNELRSRLISITSHEFRTPLTTIKSNVDLMQHKIESGINEPQKLHKNFMRLHSEIARLNHIMSDILLVGRLESGKMPFNPKAYRYHTLIEEILEQDFKPWQDRINYSCTGKAQLVNLDVNMYRHVVGNLISNAIKYSDAEVGVEVEYTNKEVHFRVKDKGIGIPKAEHERLFESFFRASNAEVKPGTGLGLTLVKQFSDIHQAQLKVQSEQNKGSTFTVIHTLI
jgi:PAS domain S-box-containing protein